MFNSRKWLVCILIALLLGACNPFAPAFDEDGLTDQNLLGDRTTLDGLFEYFKNAYEIRDTSLYGRLFSSDFRFTYHDFDQNADVSWDKGQEMVIQYNLFRNVQRITLDWNFYVEKSVDTSETSAFVNRNFNLNIVQNDNQVFTGTGRAKMKMRRDRAEDPWMIYEWFDDSDF